MVLIKVLVILLMYVLITHSNDKFYVNECQKDWVYYEPEKCIKIFNSKVNYAEAIEECHKLNSTLITIESKEENMFITSLLYGIDSQEKGLYIGLKRKKLNGEFLNKFEWEDTTDFKFENWAPGEPTPYNEDCVEIYHSGADKGKWNDLMCSRRQFAICQQFINTTVVFPFENCGNSEYVRHRDSCYRIYDKESAMNWTQANDHCINDHKNGSLLWIENRFEHSFIQYWTQLNMKSIEFWIGLYSKKESLEMQYKWINDWPVYYTSWSSNEPSIRSEIEHQCVTQDRDSGLWRNNPFCDDKRAFICKISNQSIPGDEYYINGFCPEFIDKTNNDTKNVWLNLHKRSKYCYWFSDKQSMDWSSSLKYCRSRNGSLVSIHSKDESDFLKPFIIQYHKNIWIGLYQSPPGQYRWEDGSDIDFINWFSKVPNNDFNELCVEIRAEDMSWNEVKCKDHELQFICQIQKVIPNSNKTKDDGKEALIRDNLGIKCKNDNNVTKASIKGDLNKNSNTNKSETKALIGEKDQKSETKNSEEGLSGGVVLLIIMLIIIIFIIPFFGYYLWVKRDAGSVDNFLCLKYISLKDTANMVSNNSQLSDENEIL